MEKLNRRVLCSKEGCRQQRTSNKPWCKTHIAEATRDYRATVLHRAERRGFAEGARSMKASAMKRFLAMRNANLTGEIAAEIVRQTAAEPS